MAYASLKTKAAAEKRRAERWNTQFIPCKNHPERRCNRSAYVISRTTRCGSCWNRHTDGTPHLPFSRRNLPFRKDGARRKAVANHAVRQILDRSMKRRAMGCHSLSLQGLKLFERITGVNYATQI